MSYTQHGHEPVSPYPPLPITTPTTWTGADFSNEATWVFIRGITTAAAVSVGAGGISIQGLEAFGAALERRNVAGVISRGLFYPSVNNLLDLRLTIEHFINPADQDNNDRMFSYGMCLGLPGSSYNYRWPYAGFGKQGAFGNKYGELYQLQAEGNYAVIASGGNGVVPDDSTITIRLECSMKQVNANVQHLGIRRVRWQQAVNWDLNTQATLGAGCIMQMIHGLRLMIGLFQYATTNVGRAQITQLEMLEGRYYPL